MKTERVWKKYWSATGTTKTVVSAIADRLAAELGLAVETYDFTLPAARRTAFVLLRPFFHVRRLCGICEKAKE